MQEDFNNLEKEIEESLAKKKGQIRSLFGGRYNWTSRAVITSDPTLRSSQVRLPYKACVEMLQQVIINVLHRSYGISYDAAWKIWYKSKIKRNEKVYAIIKGLIEDSAEGLPVFINRPPTIQYGSILFMRVVGINDNYTMSVPLEDLQLFAGDFDGDALSIMLIINKAVEAAAEEVFSPRYSMYISRNDGMFNNDINHQKDIIIAACGLIGMSRKYYTDEELAIIHKAQRMTEDIIPAGDGTYDTMSTTTASVHTVPQTYYSSIDEELDKEFIARCRHYAMIYDNILE
jgi:DNA-directed RNA polymerase beta' subunit